VQKLRAMAAQCMAQLLHLCEQKGGGQVYLPKGVAVRLSLRDREMCAKFRGDYRTLAREYGLTEVRVRQIVDTYQRERFLRRQSDLPGMDAA
jgi:Mor family transcriptional regulator